jgi:hypothetical protein
MSKSIQSRIVPDLFLVDIAGRVAMPVNKNRNHLVRSEEQNEQQAAVPDIEEAPPSL